MGAELFHLPQMLVNYRMNGYGFLMFKRYQVEQDSHSRLNSREPNGLTNKPLSKSISLINIHFYYCQKQFSYFVRVLFKIFDMFHSISF